MKKLSFGMFMALLAIGIAFVGCPTEAGDGGGPDPNDVLPDTGQPGQTYTVTFKSNYLGLMTDAADITVQAKYGESLGLKLPATGTLNFDNPERQSVPSFTNIPTGRQFREWNTKLDGSGITFTAKTKVKGNIAIYAIWEGKYNLSAQMYPNLFQLQYNSYGGKDAEGVYNYHAVIPVNRFGGIPGKILSGKTFTLNIEMVACYNVDSAVSLSLADASVPGIPKNLSNVISTGNKPVTGEQVELLNKVLITTSAAANFSPDASVLLISADLPILTEKLPLYATVSLEQPTGSVDPSPEFSVDITNAPTAVTNFDAEFMPGYTFSMPSTNITLNSDSVSFVLSEGMPAWGIPGPASGSGGFIFTTPYNLSAYSKVDVEYTANKAFQFKPMSVAFNEDGVTDTINSSTPVDATSSKTTKTISLTASSLSVVKSILIDGLSAEPLSEVTIYRITFKK
jgi:hypothetical protein